MPNKEEKRITEQSSLYEHLEKMSVDELTAHINAENKKVALAIEEALPAINQLISAIEGQLKKGGRLFYAGCGTGGRLATLDTIEVQNTYGIDGSQIQAIFPGGIGCLTQTRESREDDLENGWHQLCDKHISKQDFVLGFSASGTTPFVLAILKHCKEAGIPTGCIVNNPHAPIAQAADYPVEVITGPEFVTGSTRMKAGSSQKMILDMISTSLQIRQGRVEGNKMVNAKLINFVRDTAKVPVIETGAGVVHCYFDKDGDLEMGKRIITNAKCRRVSVCNALDCLLIHESRLSDLPALCEGLAEKQTKIHADAKAYEALKGHYPDTLLYKAEESEAKMKEADANVKSIWNTEWLSMQMGIKTVASEDEALDHIATYGSGHSESIVSNDEAAQKKFQAMVDAACVYVNAPTSFTDGAQFGLGAEIGISTQKLGARGPMALEEITTYKWLITGQGQIRK